MNLQTTSEEKSKEVHKKTSPKKTKDKEHTQGDENLSTQILSNIIHFTKYARYLPEKNRRETWEETIQRNLDMHTKKYPFLREEITEVYKKFVFTKKVLPSMRSTQFSGKPIELSNVRLYNCSFTPIDSWCAFSEIAFLLLNGCGVGFSVQTHHIEKLPSIRKPTRRRRFVISDDIIGWADAFKALIRAYLDGKFLPEFEFGDIRPKGSLLKTSGGKAPGPEPLKKALKEIHNLLENKENGQKLNSLECHDVVCHIADCVLSGGVRRSALLSLFNKDDKDMIYSKGNYAIEVLDESPQNGGNNFQVIVKKVKDGKEKIVFLPKDQLEKLHKTGNLPWWYFEPQRGRANNSAMFIRHKAKKRDFLHFWNIIKKNRSGEPGIIFSNNEDFGFNPCSEASLRPYGLCVSGDTPLITKKGLVRNIKDAIGQKIEIWNGKTWSKVSPFLTGSKRKLFRVYFSDGSYLDATSNHKFLVKNRFESKYREMETTELLKAIKTEKYILYCPNPKVNYCTEEKEKIYAYEYGFFLGDGNVDKRKNQNKGYLVATLFNEKRKVNLKGRRRSNLRYNVLGTAFETIVFENLNFEFCQFLKSSSHLPDEIFSWSRDSILKFISGWADADGSKASRGIRIYSIEEQRIRDLQLLLTKVGIKSSVNLMAKKGSKTNYGVRSKDTWYCQITKTSDLQCQRLICDNLIEYSNKNKNQVIRKIKKLPGVHNTYCLTENKLHQCLFANVLTKQCNLNEINASNIKDQDDLNERCKAAAFIGTLQAGYTNFHYLKDAWKETVERDALLGVSLTGLAGIDYKSFDWVEAVSYILDTNEKLAEKLRLKPAARTTCIKPSGSTSLILGCSAGIHPWFSKYYIRRVQVNKQENIYKYLKNTIPELIEDWEDNPMRDAFIKIPMKAPKGAIVSKEETAINFLERVAFFNKYWIYPGHQRGDNTHNVSATCFLDSKEYDKIGEWLWEHRNEYCGLSFLPRDGGTYKQAPHEEITKEKYEQMIQHLKKVDLSKVKEDEDVTNRSGALACSNGGCEL